MKKQYINKNDIQIKNREINFKYDIIEKFECGIELKGTEVKSIRDGMCNLKDSFALIRNGEILLKNMHISPYEQGNIFNKDPLRVRRLLMHKREILHLFGQIKQQGYTLIPLSVYFKGSNIKIQVGLCKGKKLYDKRESAAVRDMNRSIARAVKEREY